MMPGTRSLGARSAGCLPVEVKGQTTVQYYYHAAHVVQTLPAWNLALLGLTLRVQRQTKLRRTTVLVKGAPSGS